MPIYSIFVYSLGRRMKNGFVYQQSITFVCGLIFFLLNANIEHSQFCGRSLLLHVHVLIPVLMCYSLLVACSTSPETFVRIKIFDFKSIFVLVWKIRSKLEMQLNIPFWSATKLDADCKQNARIYNMFVQKMAFILLWRKATEKKQGQIHAIFSTNKVEYSAQWFIPSLKERNGQSTPGSI